VTGVQTCALPISHIIVAPLLTTEPAMGQFYSVKTAKSLVFLGSRRTPPERASTTGPPPESTRTMRERRVLVPAQTAVWSTSARRSQKIAWHPDLPTLLRQATPAMRARLMLELQRTVGNAAAGELVTEPPRSNPTVHGGGPSVSLHGDTTAEYDGGVSNWTPKSMKRVKTCTECPDDDPCLHAVGTFNVAYNAKVTIQMPDVPDGLTECPDDDACALFCVMCWIPMRANTPGGSAPTTARPPIRSISPVAAPAHFRSTCRRFTTPRRRSGMPMPTHSRLPSIRSTGR